MCYQPVAPQARRLANAVMGSRMPASSKLLRNIVESDIDGFATEIKSGAKVDQEVFEIAYQALNHRRLEFSEVWSGEEWPISQQRANYILSSRFAYERDLLIASLRKAEVASIIFTAVLSNMSDAVADLQRCKGCGTKYWIGQDAVAVAMEFGTGLTSGVISLGEAEGSRVPDLVSSLNAQSRESRLAALERARPSWETIVVSLMRGGRRTWLCNKCNAANSYRRRDELSEP
jgi:hypothetical protein